MSARKLSKAEQREAKAKQRWEARDAQSKKIISDLYGRVHEFTSRNVQLGGENDALQGTLKNSTVHLKRMCDLCDKQRDQLADLRSLISTNLAQLSSQDVELTRLKSFIHMLVRVITKEAT
jgi:predicted  nucleic acid-binding Zn-ribbon protein